MIKTWKEGVKVLSIGYLKSKKFSLKDLLKAKEDRDINQTESLQIKINPFDIVIATTQNERVAGGKYMRSVKLIKVKVAKM